MEHYILLYLAVEVNLNYLVPDIAEALLFCPFII